MAVFNLFYKSLLFSLFILSISTRNTLAQGNWTLGPRFGVGLNKYNIKKTPYEYFYDNNGKINGYSSTGSLNTNFTPNLIFGVSALFNPDSSNIIINNTRKYFLIFDLLLQNKKGVSNKVGFTLQTLDFNLIYSQKLKKEYTANFGAFAGFITNKKEIENSLRNKFIVDHTVNMNTGLILGLGISPDKASTPFSINLNYKMTLLNMAYFNPCEIGLCSPFNILPIQPFLRNHTVEFLFNYWF